MLAIQHGGSYECVIGLLLLILLVAYGLNLSWGLPAWLVEIK